MSSGGKAAWSFWKARCEAWAWGSPGRKRLDGEGLWADVWLVGRVPASGLHRPSLQIQTRDHIGWLLFTEWTLVTLGTRPS